METSVPPPDRRTWRARSGARIARVSLALALLGTLARPAGAQGAARMPCLSLGAAQQGDRVVIHYTAGTRDRRVVRTESFPAARLLVWRRDADAELRACRAASPRGAPVAPATLRGAEVSVTIACARGATAGGAAVLTLALGADVAPERLSDAAARALLDTFAPVPAATARQLAEATPR